jgi:hypothetical protein
MEQAHLRSSEMAVKYTTSTPEYDNTGVVAEEVYWQAHVSWNRPVFSQIVNGLKSIPSRVND